MDDLEDGENEIGPAKKEPMKTEEEDESLSGLMEDDDDGFDMAWQSLREHFVSYDASSVMNGAVGWTDLNRREEGENEIGQEEDESLPSEGYNSGVDSGDGDDEWSDIDEEEEMPSFPEKTKRRLYSQSVHDTPVPEASSGSDPKQKRSEEIQDLPSPQDFVLGLGDAANLSTNYEDGKGLTSTRELQLSTDTEEDMEEAIPRQSQRLKAKARIEEYNPDVSEEEGMSDNSNDEEYNPDVSEEEGMSDNSDDEEYNPDVSEEEGMSDNSDEYNPDVSEEEGMCKKKGKPSQPAKFRLPYSSSEERAIVDFFMEHGGYRMRKGQAVWKMMESMKICQGRTWESMKGCWERYVSKDLKKFKVTHKELIEADIKIHGEVEAGKKFYSRKEDLKIIKYLLENRRYQDVGGESLWKALKFSNLLCGH